MLRVPESLLSGFCSVWVRVYVIVLEARRCTLLLARGGATGWLRTAAHGGSGRAVGEVFF